MSANAQEASWIRVILVWHGYALQGKANAYLQDLVDAGLVAFLAPHVRSVKVERRLKRLKIASAGLTLNSDHPGRCRPPPNLHRRKYSRTF